MKSRAAVAFEAKMPLEIVELDVEGPKAGEVLVEIMATGICHTDAYTLEGLDNEGLFPSVLGHEGAGVVREIGRGVTSVAVGDHVIPLYTPECRQCKSCLSQKTNLCTAIRVTQGKGLMPDGTSRFSYKGRPVFHYMGCSTFSNVTVLPEIAVARIRKDAPFDTSCYVGCGVTTGVSCHSRLIFSKVASAEAAATRRRFIASTAGRGAREASSSPPTVAPAPRPTTSQDNGKDDPPLLASETGI